MVPQAVEISDEPYRAMYKLSNMRLRSNCPTLMWPWIICPLMSNAEEIPISLIRGGALYWAQEKVGLIRRNQWNLGRRIFVAVAVAWIPLVVLAAMHSGTDLRELLTDYRIYSRVLIAIPLLLIAQVGMEGHFREMAEYFIQADLVRAEDLGRFGGIMTKARHLRDAKLPEVLVMAAVILQIAYMLESGRLKNVSWITDSGIGALTPAGYYSTFVTQGIFMVLLGLVLWKWLIWILVMRDLANIDLQLDPTDGDLNSGLGFLSEIPKAFLPVLLAISAVIGATWRFQVLAGQVELKSLVMPAAVLAALVLLIFVGPLALFTPKLLKSKGEGQIEYGTLRHLHSLEFRKRWVQERNEHLPELLGTRDVSSLSGISSSFRNIDEMKVFPFRRSTIVAMLAALALPMVPVLTTEIPLKELLKKLLEALH